VSRQFQDFKATELFCPQCQTTRLVRERPAGDAIELLCSRCATVVGRHTTVDHSLTVKISRLADKLFGTKS
jgi:hypothetical protein